MVATSFEIQLFINHLKLKIMNLFETKKGTANKSYDNEGAKAMVLFMMNRSEQINVKFRIDQNGYPYAWVESKKVSGFKLLLNKEGLNWMYNYLYFGKTEDFGFNPNNVEVYNPNKNFQVLVLKQLINAGKMVQFTPMFRENLGYISALASAKKGKISFKVERTTDLVEWLEEKELIYTMPEKVQPVKSEEVKETSNKKESVKEVSKSNKPKLSLQDNQSVDKLISEAKKTDYNEVILDSVDDEMDFLDDIMDMYI